jgi:class 3 adenylate cyclase/tetratricopeptide (TPR) repeat protein
MAGDTRKERKVVTVVFVDLVGFTARAESLDPEDVEAILRPYHERLRAELERFGGTVEKFIGDAVMALFGAPVSREDDAERAVRAALAIRDWAREEEGLQVRIGLSTGEALVSLAARPDVGETMAAGDVVNTAARLQAAAPVNGILVGEGTFRATRDAVDYREAEAVEAKGKAEPVPVWEAVQARSAFGVDVEQPAAAPLVGRVRELESLADALERARRERSPQLVTLVGVPGIGKTRLVRELFAAVEADPELIVWRQGRSLPYGEGVSFWSLAEMVKAEAGVLETDAPEEVEAKLGAAAARLLPDEAEARWVESHLRPLTGLASEAEIAGDRRAEAFAAWRQLFEALADRQPTVLVFEDLHWADDGVLEFVDHLVDWASGVPLLVVCTARPELLERRPGWGGGKLNALTVSLAPLSDGDTAHLVASLLDRPVLEAETQALLLARAGGNPLYAEQYVRMLAERAPGEDLPVPETVQGIIAARLDGLAGEEKALLQDAAVIGKVFWAGALAGDDSSSRRVVEERLHALERKEFVLRSRRSSVAGETEYAFRHLLLRDVAYGQIPRAERAERHRRAAEWIESLGRPEDHAEMLAHHYVSALDLARAAGLDTAAIADRARGTLREAGERAFGLYAYASAARFYAAALDLWPGGDSERPHLLLRYGYALYHGEGTGGDVLEEAREALLGLGNREEAAEADALLAELWWHRGQRDRAFEHLERAQELVREARPSRAKAWVLCQASRYSMLAEENEAAIALGREALEMAEALGLEELRAHALNNIGTARSRSDPAGLVDIERSIEIARSVNSPEAWRGYNNLETSLVLAGELERAWSMATEARALIYRFGIPRYVTFARVHEIGEHYMRGSWDVCLELVDAFIAECEAGAPRYLEPDARGVRALVRAARGDVAGAAEDAQRGLEQARETKDPQSLYPSIARGGWAFAAAGRDAEANALADELLELLSSGATGMLSIPELAWLLVGYGRGAELLAVLDRRNDRPTPWLEGGRAAAGGDFVQAAGIFGAIGARPHEGLARLHAARAFREAGRGAEAEAQLLGALAFYRSVGAARLVREAESLLAASA